MILHLRIGRRTFVTSSFCLFMSILRNKHIELKIRATAESQVFDVIQDRKVWAGWDGDNQRIIMMMMMIQITKRKYRHWKYGTWKRQMTFFVVLYASPCIHISYWLSSFLFFFFFFCPIAAQYPYLFQFILEWHGKRIRIKYVFPFIWLSLMRDKRKAKVEKEKSKNDSAWLLELVGWVGRFSNVLCLKCTHAHTHRGVSAKVRQMCVNWCIVYADVRFKFSSDQLSNAILQWVFLDWVLRWQAVAVTQRALGENKMNFKWSFWNLFSEKRKTLYGNIILCDINSTI